jgi:hypothetical protein
VQPLTAVVSVGRDNGYGLPSPETLGRLEPRPVFRTDVNGDIEITMDGERLWPILCKDLPKISPGFSSRGDISLIMGAGSLMESVLFLLIAAVPVLVVVLTAGAMWLYPEIDLSVRLAGARFELHGWRPSMRTERRRAKRK